MYPGNCASFWKFSDELYLILDFILQKHFLKFHNSLFAENFYGLERKLKNTNSVTLTLLCNVLLPYLKLKCDRLFEKFGNEILDSKLKKCFVAVYPYLHMTWEGSTTLFVILYCIGKSRHHSPFVFLSRSVVGHSVNDVSTYDAVKSFGEKSVQRVAKILASGLQFGAFFLQFLDWWWAVWQESVIYWTLGNFSNPLATITLPNFPTFLDNFCKDVKIFNFSSEIIFGQLL